MHFRFGGRAGKKKRKFVRACTLRPAVRANWMDDLWRSDLIRQNIFFWKKNKTSQREALVLDCVRRGPCLYLNKRPKGLQGCLVLVFHPNEMAVMNEEIN